MGLRINTNVPALRALRSIQRNDAAQSRSLERLASGLRINRGADDPSGLVISEQLRAQIAELKQAVINTQDASNLLSVADASLQEVSDLLQQISDSVIFAQNTGVASTAQIAAEQDAVNQAIAAVDRIASTTRFGGEALLNGTKDYQLTEQRPPELQNLKIRSLTFAQGQTERTLLFTVTANPQRAQILVSNVASTGTTAGTVLRVTGERGTNDVVLASGATAQEIATAINTVAGFTGVFASGTAGPAGDLNIFSEGFGRDVFIKIEALQGKISGAGIFFRNDNEPGATAFTTMGIGAALSATEIASDRGRDGQITFEGQSFRGVGAKFNILTPLAQLEFDLNPDLVPLTVGTSSAVVSASFANTAMTFQLREFPRPTDRIDVGIEGINASVLGFEAVRDRVAEATAGISAGASAGAQILQGGFLNSIKTGGANDLFNDPANAGFVVREAIEQVTRLRGFLGATVADALDPNIRSVNVEIENLSASLSTIRDLDFAEETAAFIRNQVLVQSSLAVLANAAAAPQAVLQLLQG